MRLVVFGGSGKIGSAVAFDLAADPAVERIGLVGRNADALERTRRWLGSPAKVVAHALDVEDAEAVSRVMREYDAGALALPDRRTSYLLMDRAIGADLPVVDMLEEFHRRPDAYETENLALRPGMSLDEYGEWLHEEATRRGVTVLDGMGFAPGLSNITLGDGIRSLDVAHSAIARVGGIPSKEAAPRHPLRYMITWSFDHVLREYMIGLKVVKDGKVVDVPAGSDRESFRFRAFGRDETLECAITPGMPSFIFTRPQLREFAEKTVRWPGHWQGVETLKECGLLDLDPVGVDGARVVPRRLLAELIGPRLVPRPGETDVCVMYNTLVGRRGADHVRLEWLLWDEADTTHGISAMQRTTGYPVAIAVRMLARRRIPGVGIVAPEDGIAGPLYREFLAELERRGIVIEERTIPLESGAALQAST